MFVRHAMINCVYYIGLKASKRIDELKISTFQLKIYHCVLACYISHWVWLINSEALPFTHTTT